MSDTNAPVRPRRISGQPVLHCLIAFFVLANGVIAYWRLQEEQELERLGKRAMHTFKKAATNVEE